MSDEYDFDLMFARAEIWVENLFKDLSGGTDGITRNNPRSRGRGVMGVNRGQVLQRPEVLPQVDGGQSRNQRPPARPANNRT